LGFLISFTGFQIELYCLLRLETCFSKDSVCISWSFDLSLLLIRLYFLLLSGVWVFCQIDLALLFSATSFLISQGVLFVGLWGSLFGVVSLVACWIKLSKMLVSSSISSCSWSFIDRFNSSCIIFL
jgi:hypothetical protein